MSWQDVAREYWSDPYKMAEEIVRLRDQLATEQMTGAHLTNQLASSESKRAKLKDACELGRAFFEVGARIDGRVFRWAIAADEAEDS